MTLQKISTSMLFLVSTLLFASEQISQTTIQKPKLILQITVDQLRGDLPDKFMKHMGEGRVSVGLKEKGVMV